MLQYFLTENKSSIFENNRLPQLLYICNTETMQKNFPRALHKHDDRLEIVFIVKGKGEHLIGDVKYHTQAGDILIFNQNIIHDEMAQLNSDMVVYCCGIKNLKIKGMDENCLFDIHAPAVIKSGKQQDAIQKILDLMFFHVKEQPNYAKEVCHYLLASLLNIVVHLPRDNSSVRNKKLTLIEQVKHYLDGHYWEDITLESLALRFNINSFYLIHLFKENTGFSPVQYLIRRRIGEAQSLLTYSNHSVAQIASMVGYANANYFSTLFTKVVGISPKNYRTSWIGK